MNDRDPFGRTRPPTAKRPLLGMTVLAVEDSRYASEALRLMCLRSGARIRRADCLRAARRHLQVYRPSVLVVDLGLPDGSGLDLIAELSRALPRIGAVIATSGGAGADMAALAAGADAFLEKPICSLGMFQQTVLSALPPERRPAQPALVSQEHLQPDNLAYRDDMHHIATLLEDADTDATLGYAAQFLGSVATAAGDLQLRDAAQALQACELGGPSRAQMARLKTLVQDRIREPAEI